MTVGGQLYTTVTLTLGIEPPSTHKIVGWMDPTAGLDVLETTEKYFLVLLYIGMRLGLSR